MDLKTDLTKLWRTKKGRQLRNLQWKLVLIVHADRHQGHFFKRNPISNKGDQKETIGDGTDIHRQARFQRQQPTSGGTVRSSRPANCSQHIPSHRFLDSFADLSQFAAAKLTHYSSKPPRPSNSSRSWKRILLSGDVYQNPGHTIKYPCPVCACNVTGRGVSYLCNRCSGWVHSKCSGLQNAAEYRRIKDWVFSFCNSLPTLPKLQPPPIPTQTVDGNSFTIMQFNANGIGNKLTELGEFLK